MTSYLVNFSNSSPKNHPVMNLTNSSSLSNMNSHNSALSLGSNIGALLKDNSNVS
eukprot:CAMPEP_0171393926 /NCGR_PEP_ID=MMETSP0880-20121228/2982_1 /TAXON_ID=67004 /ORGANISM="Thalassiosira weissflogii, Strain CCMP1336" /LENGTH=54 /DNA_ID=CAMNT_0011907173 /DNA_START=83 /DNA_END=243 /DNA_ORIENTATION=+